MVYSEDPDEKPPYGGISSGSALFVKSENDLQRKKYNVCGNYNL